MATDAERLTRIETRVDDLTKETSELRGAYAHLATKEDVSKSTATVLKWMFGAIALPIWIALAGVVALFFKG